MLHTVASGGHACRAGIGIENLPLLLIENEAELVRNEDILAPGKGLAEDPFAVAAAGDIGLLAFPLLRDQFGQIKQLACRLD